MSEARVQLQHTDGAPAAPSDDGWQREVPTADDGAPQLLRALLEAPRASSHPPDDSGQAAAAAETAPQADGLGERVQREQLQSLMSLSGIALGVNGLAALVFSVVLSVMVPPGWVAGWLCAVLAVGLARCLLAWQFQRRSARFSSPRPWMTTATVLVGLQGLGWAAVVAMLPGDAGRPEVTFMLVVLAALAFGGFSLLGFHLPASVSFAAPVLAAICAWFAWSAVGLPAWMPLAVLAAVLGISVVAVHTSQLVRRSMRLAHEREDLIGDLNAEKDNVQVTLNSIGDGVLTTDTGGCITYLNPVAERLTGWSVDEARGRPLGEVLLLGDPDSVAPADPVAACLSHGGVLRLEQETALWPRQGRHEHAVEVTASPIRASTGGNRGVVVVIHDVSELRSMARVMAYQAQHDTLTGLINRREFEIRLWNAINRARDGQPSVMCYLDLDQFKVVNDTCGHLAGDELLKDVAERLRGRLGEEDVLARLGGDEFGLLLRAPTEADACRRGEALAAALRDYRFSWDGRSYTVSASMGLVSLADGGTPADVLAAADAACYLAKDQGRSRVQVAHPRDPDLLRHQGQMRWTTRIHDALEEDAFRLRFQRIMPLRQGAPVLAELLLTMLGADGESIAPGSFIPAGERFSRMPVLDRRVVRLALEAIADPAHRQQLAGIDVFSINLSGQSLSDEAFLEYCLEQIRNWQVPEGSLCFEITETAVIANLDRAKAFIEALKNRGCLFALDDFGSGVSSFGYLRRLPVDFLKIDGTFVRHIARDTVDYRMVESINEVGQMMGIRTIAEYVEDQAIRGVVERIGIDYGQGFAIHRPQFLAAREAGRR